MKAAPINKGDSLGKDELYCEWYECPNCHDKNVRPGQNYCGECGIKIEWYEKVED